MRLPKFPRFLKLPKPPEPTMAEGLLYVFIAALAAAVIAGAAHAPGEAVSPDFRLAVAQGTGR